MVATVNASTSAGVVITPDNSGVLAFQSSSATALTIDASQNVTLVGTLTTTGITNSGVATGARFNPTGSSVTGNGLYLPAANSLGLSTNGTNAVYIDSSQNVGIGTTTPARRLHVKAAGVTTLGNSNGALFTDASNAGVLLGSDNVLGYISGVTVAGTATVDLALQPFGGNLLVGSTSGSTHVIKKDSASSTVLSIINTSGTSPSCGVFNFSAAAPNNGTQTFWAASDTSAYRGGLLSNGGLQNYQVNNSNLSDQREKKNIQLAPNYLDKICQIPVKTFLFNDQTDTDLNLGSIAQDVQAVCPELITESNWGTEEEPKMRLSIYQTDLQYALMKSIQELKAINDTQAELISGQAETINALTARVTALEGA